MRSSLIETLGEDYIRTARAKGLTPAAGAVAACAAQRADPGADDHRAAVLVPARGRDHHRERVLPAGPRAAGVPGDHPARPDRGGVGGDAAGLRGDPRHLPRGRGLCGGRPAAEAAAHERWPLSLRCWGALRSSAVFVAGACAGRRSSGRPTTSGARTSPTSCSRLRRRTGSAPIISAATSCR